MLNAALQGGQTETLEFFSSTFLLRGEIEPKVYGIFEKARNIFKTRITDKEIFPKHTPVFAAKQIADDKKLMYQFFERNGFPFAESIFFNFSSIIHANNNVQNSTQNKETKKLFESLKKTLHTPFVAKPRFGSQGRGIMLIEDIKSFNACLAQNQNGELIFQQFIKGSDGFSFDLRFFVCGGTVTACALRKSSHHFLSNFHAGGQMQIIKKPEDLKEHGICGVNAGTFAQMQQLAVNAVQKAGLLYGSADFLILQNSRPVKFFLCEINASPGFEGIENAANTKTEIVPRLIDAVMNL